MFYLLLFFFIPLSLIIISLLPFFLPQIKSLKARATSDTPILSGFLLHFFFGIHIHGKENGGRRKWAGKPGRLLRENIITSGIPFFFFCLLSLPSTLPFYDHRGFFTFCFPFLNFPTVFPFPGESATFVSCSGNSCFLFSFFFFFCCCGCYASFFCSSEYTPFPPPSLDWGQFSIPTFPLSLLIIFFFYCIRFLCQSAS